MNNALYFIIGRNNITIRGSAYYSGRMFKIGEFRDLIAPFDIYQPRLEDWEIGQLMGGN